MGKGPTGTGHGAQQKYKTEIRQGQERDKSIKRQEPDRHKIGTRQELFMQSNK